MKNTSKNIILQGLLFLLVGVAPLAFAGNKTIKAGFGYKQFVGSAHNNLIHSGRYVYGGYDYAFGDKFKQAFGFQISNSNREIQIDLPYVTACTNISMAHEFNLPIYTKGRWNINVGAYVGNSFNLNFFPRIDNENFIWENLTSVGISSRNRFVINNKGNAVLNFKLPVYSGYFSHRFDRLTGEFPPSYTSLWNTIDKSAGSLNKLFNPSFELGYQYNIAGIQLGAFYQSEFNWVSKYGRAGTLGQAHSLSLRIHY